MARALPMRRARDGKRLLVRGAAIAVLVTVVAATALQLQPRDESIDAAPVDAELTGAAEELVELLERDRTATFHARYEVSSPELAGAAVSFETWRRPPNVRSDIEVRRPDGIVRTRQLVLETGSVACESTDDGPWACAKAPDIKDPFEGSILEQVSAAESVTAEDRTIDGRAVRCFMLTTGDVTAEFCATAEGVPVLVASAGTTMRLLSLDHEVGDEFEPPAEPVA